MLQSVLRSPHFGQWASGSRDLSTLSLTQVKKYFKYIWYVAVGVLYYTLYSEVVRLTGKGAGSDS